MELSDNLAAGFLYLSQVASVSPSAVEGAVEILNKKIRYIPEDMKVWYNWYLDWYKTYELFPSWEQFKSASKITNEPPLTHTQAQELFVKNLAIWETDYMANNFNNLSIQERREALNKMATALSIGSQETSVELKSTATFELEGEVIRDEKEVLADFVLPVQHMNTISVVKPGNFLSVIAAPGHFKTAFSLNTVYLNSIRGNKNTLYIYLENRESSYQAELRSRHSFSNGMRVENSTLKRGVLKEDVNAVKRLYELEEDFKKQKKGEVYFAPFSAFERDLTKFGPSLAAYVNKYDIDFVVFDYLQRAQNFCPPSEDRRAYINLLCSIIASCALGEYHARPFIAMVLAQPKRQAEEMALKTRGKMTIYDAAECYSIERDSFMCFGLFADAEMKAANTFSYQTLKNRDESVDVSPVQCSVVPQYCFLGDMEGATASNDIYSLDVLSDSFNLDL